VTERVLAKKAASRNSLPNFLIIGAMRSGTTSVARQLGEHPDVFMAPQKEIHFFDFHWEKGIEWYRAQFRGAGDESAVGEASPSYLHDPFAIERIAGTLP
jgi:hypothetical protein